MLYDHSHNENPDKGVSYGFFGFRLQSNIGKQPMYTNAHDTLPHQVRSSMAKSARSSLGCITVLVYGKCMCVHMYVYMYLYIYMFVCIHIYMCNDVRIYIYD